MDISTEALGIAPVPTLKTIYPKYANSRFWRESDSEVAYKLISHAFHSEDTYDSSDAFKKAMRDPSLMDLVHMKYATLMANHLFSKGHVCRQEDNHISFLRNPLWDKHLLRSQESSDVAVKVSTRQNQELAIEGLISLLNDTKDKRGKSEGVSEMASDLSKGQTSSRESGIFMLLPLLTDYIKHCFDIIHSSSGKVNGLCTPGQASSKLPQSNRGSFDTLTAKLGQLSQMDTNCVSIERYTITALRCLVVMIRLRQEVGHTIIANYMTVSSTINAATPRASTSSNEMPEPDQQSKRVTCNLEGGDEYCASSSEIGNASNHTQPCLSDQLVDNGDSSTLLHLIMTLAGQDLEVSPTDPDVVKLSLSVLTSLCEYCDEEYLPKLEVIITRGILTTCFRQTKHMSVLIYAQRLLVSLTNSDKLFAGVCTKCENCPLYLLHKACLIEADGMFDLYVEYITSLSSISKHTSALNFLVCNKCPCADQVIKSVLIVLYNLFSTYKTKDKAKKGEDKVVHLITLKDGIDLINSLADVDKKYARHQMWVQREHVRMLSYLLDVVSKSSGPWILKFHLRDPESQY